MAQLALDDFNRADGELGANWASSNFAIVSNEADVSPAIATNLYGALSAPDDGYAEIVVGSVVDVTTDNGVGPIYRGSAAASINTINGYFAQTNTTETRLYKVLTGAVFTALGTDGPACATGDVLRITCNGTSISVQKNGATIIGPISDSSITSGSAGIWGAQTVTSPTINSFAFGNLTETGEYILTAEQGTYSLSGQAATLKYSEESTYTLTAEQGTYTITGSNALADYVIRAESGTYTLSGQAAGLSNGYTLTAAYGEYTLTGQAAGLAWSGAATVTPEGGLYGNINLKIRTVYVVSATDRVKWVDYIPVKQVTPGASSINTFNNDGAIAVDILADTAGLVEWVNYIPVVEVTDADSGRWRVDNDGFIPIVSNS